MRTIAVEANLGSGSAWLFQINALSLLAQRNSQTFFTEFNSAA
jgi:hypothetical protein